MFKRAGKSLAPNLRRLHSQGTTSARGVRTAFRARPGAIVSSSLVAAYILWYANSQTVHNDASPVAKLKQQGPSLIAGGDIADSEHLRTVVWGSNKSNTLTPELVEVIRTPSVAPWLDGVALRDLVLHEDHAACVDARGDVYQWGSGYAGLDPDKRRRLYALSASGKVYALATEASKQVLRPGAPTPSSDSWWGTGWLWGEDETVDFVEITPRERLSWGEKIVSIDAGNDHVLALTSKGRTFAHPVNKNANAYGQLGFRKFQIPNPAVRHRSIANGHLEVELIPKSIANPYRTATRATRPSPAPTASENLANIDDTNIRFCTNFFEIPVLRGVKIAQIEAGGRTSFARTTTGRVLGWGANEYGQIGLGGGVTLETIIIPTEVILWTLAAERDKTKCLEISAGGDLTAYIVERTHPSSPTTIDLLMCGNGQWGGLGNNVFSTAQSAPLRARNVSGLLEYSDITRSLQPIAPHAVTISPTGHVLLTLNTASAADVGGRDLVVWGKNYASELGNGKRASLPLPMTLETPEGGRFMLRRRKAKEVQDLHGKVWKRGVKVEQHAAVGPSNSTVYWRIVS